MPDQIGGFTVRKDLNITNIVGFLVIFATLVTMYNSLDFRQQEDSEWQENHESHHTRFEADYGAFRNSFHDRPQNIYRLQKVEEIQKTNIERMDRMAENYNGQFADVRTQLNAILTQIALTNAALGRLETAQRRFERGGGNVTRPE